MSCRLVIDSSLLDWSADLPQEPPDEDVVCKCDARNVMNSVLRHDYHLWLSTDLYDEMCDQLYDQKKPEYKFRQWPRLWLQTMQERRRIENVQIPFENVLQGVQMCNEMVKDAHLIESALSSDGCVISRDEKILACWIGLCHKNPPAAIVTAHPKISSIVWADPQVQGEDVVWWLDAGAPEADAEAWKLNNQSQLEHGCQDYQTDKCVLDSGRSSGGST